MNSLPLSNNLDVNSGITNKDDLSCSVNSFSFSDDTKNFASSKESSIYESSDYNGGIVFMKPVTAEDQDILMIPGLGLKRINTLKLKIMKIDKNFPNWMLYNKNKFESRSSKSIDGDDASKNEDTPDIFDLRILSVSYISEQHANLDKTNFHKIKHLTTGSRCNVFKAYLEKSKVILKVMKDFDIINPLAIEEMNHEIDVLSRVIHKNIVFMYGSGNIPSHNDTSLSRPFIVLEPLYGGSLTYHLKTKRSFYSLPFSELRYLRIAKEFADALHYLHDLVHPECVLVHRDLKPDNIGFTTEGVLKLMDFGSCIVLRRNARPISRNHRITG